MDFNLSEEEILQLVQKWNKEKEESRWKNDKKHSEFIDFIIKHIDKSVDSDTYIYDDKKIQSNYTGEEFSKLLYSLFDVVDNYAKENNVSSEIDCGYFTEEKYCLKIKDKYYSIELIVGQGSYVRMEVLENKEKLEYINYEDILFYVS